MPDVYATPNDVADRWRPLTDLERITAQTLAVDASLRIRRRFPTIDARIAAGDVDDREVTAVVASMVKNAMLTGDGVTQQSETRGPFSTTVQYASPARGLAFTEDDLATLADLAGQVGRGRRRAFAVDLSQPRT